MSRFTDLFQKPTLDLTVEPQNTVEEVVEAVVHPEPTTVEVESESVLEEVTKKTHTRSSKKKAAEE